jgi:formylmethanofuran dehydrogenase subunit E
MSLEEYINDPELEEVVNFHGHLCFGLALGFKVAHIAREEFPRPEDEEIVCIVENNSCAVDAIQYIMGCTFGKGNLVFRDYGKHAYTFINRVNKQAIRISLAGDISKKLNGLKKNEVIEYILNNPKVFLKIERFKDFSDIPPEARIHTSVECEECREPVMETRARVLEGRILCIPCFNRLLNTLLKK